MSTRLRRARRPALAAGLVAAAWTLAAAPAWAQKAVLGDLESEPALAEQAAAVSMLMRSALVPGTRTFVARGEIALALEVLTKTPRESLAVPAELAAPLMAKLAVDRLVRGDLGSDGRRLTVDVVVLGSGGKTLASASVSAARGDVARLALEAARRIAPKLDATLVPQPESLRANLSELRPFVAAEAAQLRGDPAAAARVLALADARVAGRLAAPRQLAEQVMQNPALPAADRVHAALAAGDGKTALTLTDELLTKDKNDIVARAARVRAYVALGDKQAAAAESEKLKRSNHPAALLARADLAAATGETSKRDEALLKLLDKDKPEKAALAFVSRTEPGTLTSTLEKTAVEAATKVAPQEPGLASDVAVHAVKSEVEVGSAARLVRPGDLDTAELQRIVAKVDAFAAGQEAARKLNEDMKLRKAIEEELAAEASRAEGGALPAGLPGRLMGALLRFPQIERRRLHRVAVVALADSGQPFFWPTMVDVPRATGALEAALSSRYVGAQVEPLALGRVTSGALDDAKLAAACGAANLDAALLFKLAPSGPRAQLTLFLFDTARAAHETTSEVYDDPELVRSNPLPATVGLGLLVLLIATVTTALTRGGIVVTIKHDPGAREERFTLVLSRKATVPQLGDPVAYVERLKKTGPVKRRTMAAPVGSQTRFGRLPPGRWNVHLFGTFEKAEELRPLPATVTLTTTVRARQTSFVTFNLEPTHAEFYVSVKDGEVPVPGALVYVDEERTRAQKTKRNGVAVVLVPRGLHTIRVETPGFFIERDHEVAKPTPYELAINLAWERRVDDVARALENQKARASEIRDQIQLDHGPPVLSASMGGAAHLVSASSAGGAAAGGGAGDAGGMTPDALASGPGSSAPDLGTPRNTGDLSIALGDQLRISAGALASVTDVNTLAKTMAPSGATLTGLARYQRLDELGRGAMGVVFKARDLVLERNVALKILADEIRANPLATDMFLREAKALAALSHPNIVTVFDQGQDGKEIFMVMELIEGRTLADIIRANSGRLSLPMALDLADQLCAGIGYAHEKRILHRDIKPANIFVTHQGLVKIGDFGLARAMREVRITRTDIRGTPLYMAPEQILGKDIDFRADLYSVGCTLFELFTGRPPFIEGEVLYHHLHTEPPRASEIVAGLPPEIDGILLACLQKDQARRVSSAAKLREALAPLKARYRTS